MNERLKILRLILCAAATFVAAPFVRGTEPRDTLEFQGRVVLPPHTLPRRTVLGVTLQGVDLVYSGRTLADFDGRFAFRKLKPGAYFLILNFPHDGQITRSIDITRSFADGKGRIKKEFEFSEERLRESMGGRPGTIVSARELALPYKAKALYRKAQDRLHGDDTDAAADLAVKDLEQAISIAPKFLEAINFLGTIYFQRGDRERSEEYFRRALEIDPESFEPLVNLGGALLAQRRMLEAMAVNLHAKDLRPLDALANAQLGLSYFSAKDFDRARECMERTIQIDPGHFSYPQLTLAEIDLRQNDRPAALRELRSFLSLHPDSARAEDAKGLIERIESDRAASGEISAGPLFDHESD